MVYESIGNLTSAELIHLQKLPRVFCSIFCRPEAPWRETRSSSMCAPAARNSSCLLVNEKDAVLVVCHSKSLEWDVEKLQTAKIFVQFFDVLESSSRPGIIRVEGIWNNDFALEKLVPF